MKRLIFLSILGIITAITGLVALYFGKEHKELLIIGLDLVLFSVIDFVALRLRYQKKEDE